MNRYKTILLQILVMTAISVAGCTQELLTDELPAEHNSVILSLTTRTDQAITGQENESAIKTLRLMIFNSSGAQIKNTFYTEALLDGMKKDGGNFIVTERLPRDLGQIKVCLISNEPSGWNLGRTNNQVSYTLLNNLTIHYSRDFDFISNNGNSDDLNLYLSPGDSFLMYGEATVNFVAGDVSIAEVLPLQRTAAKVTLTLGYDRLADVDYDHGDGFILKSASIRNQPIYSHLFAKAYGNDEFFSTAYKSLAYDSNTKMTRPVAFYIPEYYLPAEAGDTGLFTYIEVLGEYTTGGIKIPVTYQIPLGEGVQKIVTDASYLPVPGDYSIVRNHHYVVNGKITKLGEKEGIQTKIAIAPWIDGGEIDIEDPAPYLNVSEIALERTVSPANPVVSDKIFFWSNQRKNQIMLVPATIAYYEADGSEMILSGSSAEYLPQIDVNMTHYPPSGNGSHFFENNGHIAINIQFPAIILWDKLTVTFHVQAGSLKRQITITYHTGSISV